MCVFFAISFELLLLQLADNKMQENFLPSKLLVSKSSKVYRVFRHVPLANPCQLKWGEGNRIRPFQYLSSVLTKMFWKTNSYFRWTFLLKKSDNQKVFSTSQKLFAQTRWYEYWYALLSSESNLKTFSKNIKYVEERIF